jgi:hypothetical protein
VDAGGGGPASLIAVSAGEKMAAPFLKLENVSRLLGDRWRLRNLNPEITSGEIIAFVPIVTIGG